MSQNTENSTPIRKYFTESPSAVTRSWMKGEFLVREEEELNNLHFLVSGRFRVFRTMNNGREMMYRIHLPGSIIGDLEVFTGSDAASCSVQCIEKAVTMALPAEEIRSSPSDYGELLFTLGRGLARKLHENSVSEALNTVYTLEIRLAHYYFTFTDPELRAQNLGQLADWMGCSYRHLTRSLASLKEQKAIKQSGRTYEAGDAEILEKIAEPMLVEERGRVLFESGG